MHIHYTRINFPTSIKVWRTTHQIIYKTFQIHILYKTVQTYDIIQTKKKSKIATSWCNSNRSHAIAFPKSDEKNRNSEIGYKSIKIHFTIETSGYITIRNTVIRYEENRKWSNHLIRSRGVQQSAQPPRPNWKSAKFCANIRQADS